MKVGVTLFMQNYSDWDRYERIEAGGDRSERPAIPDAQVYQEELALGRLVEPLGFDSLWTVEHHFTPYTMVTSTLPLLNYFAGCTERIDMGTMVIVLPCHDPVRVAEGICTLDHMLAGRRIYLGFGRGLGRREFSGLRIPMDESRDRFNEAVDVIRRALSAEWFSYDGRFYTVPETSIRPQPRSSSEQLLEDMYVAWGSPQTIPIAAPLGLKPLFIPQTTWVEYAGHLRQFTDIRVDNGFEPARPTIVCWVYCADTEEKAWEGAGRYIPEYADSAMRHYEIAAAHFGKIKGYEHYAASSQIIRQLQESGRDLNMGSMYLQNQVWGTPEQCIDKLGQINELMGPDQFVAVFKYGAMPADAAEASMRLFAREVLPALKEMPLAAFPVAEPVAS